MEKNKIETHLDRRKVLVNFFLVIKTRTKTSTDSNQEEEKRMRERKGEKVKIERVTFIHT